MKNPRISKKEHGLIKGALRRVFSRSDLRKMAIALARIEHSDPKRRTKKWVRCKECNEPTPEWMCQADHIVPCVPLDTSFDQMEVQVFIDNLWCELDNLQILCHTCHKRKSALEASERKRLNPRKRKKKHGS